MMTMPAYRYALIFSFVILFAINAATRPAAGFDDFIRSQNPDFLTYEELCLLSKDPFPGGAVEKKLNRFWETPTINNEAWYEGVRPTPHDHALLGRHLRVVSWNIEKSYKIEKAVEAFTDTAAFEKQIDPAKAEAGSDARRMILGQQKKLLSADIVLLQEMDIGVKRSGYIDAAKTLAQAMKMNYAYAAEQLEVDPVMLGTEKLYYEKEDGGQSRVDQESTDYYRVDPAKEKGAFGIAVLSHYPIKKAVSFQLKTKPYDWYYGEKNKVTFLEHSRRFGAKEILENEITREIKVGGRTFFRVDLEVPGLPEDTLTIINIHLEIKCRPEGREAQILEILSYIQDIKHPVIMAGDFNSASGDLSPTSVSRVVKRTAKNPTTWLSLGINYLTANGLLINTLRSTSNLTRNYQDPTARNIPVIAPNPASGLFKSIENFRFEDGGAFDFRGDKNRSINEKNEKLANSNQRDLKGFKTTFSVKRPVGIWGKYRLDWFFVKSFLKNPEDKSGPYQLAPHFGETLEELNTGLKIPISDHHPSVIDMPFEEPVKLDSSDRW